MLAFLSYQSEDKAVAGSVQTLLASFGVEAFLAHEHIDVSDEWRLTLLEKLGQSDLFVPILSKHYFNSVWCVQESGIAAFRKLTIVPLSIDGTIPSGFFSHIQSTRINSANPTPEPLLKAMAKVDLAFTIEGATKRLAASTSYSAAQDNFGLLQPFLGKASDAQKVAVLNSAALNRQIYEAGDCIRTYLPPLFKTHGHLLADTPRKTIEQAVQPFIRN